MIDTVRSWKLAAPPGDSTQLTGFLLLPTPPGTWSVAVVLSDLARAAGTGQRIGSVAVVAFDGKTLRLSDPILGIAHERTCLGARRRDHSAQPAQCVATRRTCYSLISGRWTGDRPACTKRTSKCGMPAWQPSKTFRTSVAFTTPATSTRMLLAARTLAPRIDQRVTIGSSCGCATP